MNNNPLNLLISIFVCILFSFLLHVQISSHYTKRRLNSFSWHFFVNKRDKFAIKCNTFVKRKSLVCVFFCNVTLNFVILLTIFYVCEIISKTECNIYKFINLQWYENKLSLLSYIINMICFKQTRNFRYEI